MPHATETVADTPPELLRVYYRPNVVFEKPDFAFTLGDYRFVFLSDGMHSPGAIQYKFVLLVLDPDDFDVLYVTAETNDLEGEAMVYLGRFTPQRHTTITKSPAFAHRGFFFSAACMVAREALDLPYEQFPMLAIEDAALGAIHQGFQAVFPDGAIDEETRAILNWITKGVMRSMGE
jgi:hypothetical protein